MLSWNEILLRLALASFLGALIGLERERKHWAAGLRTHMMVCVGACLIMIVSAFGFKDVLGTPDVALDPSRIAAQVISGIGFIGAGTILFSKQGTVHGLTTASGLWTVAAIGLAIGGGLYFAAVATTVAALIILWALQPLEQLYSKKFQQRTLKITSTTDTAFTHHLFSLIEGNGLKIQSFSLQKQGGDITYELKLDFAPNEKLDAFIILLQQESTIQHISWEQ
ncbi:MAG: MgtC/SapB family protein [Chitinophagales bacterium]|nr:MgtC/SapB family protein [Chitinophagales bacterium]